MAASPYPSPAGTRVYYQCPHNPANPRHAAAPDHPRTVKAPEPRLDQIVRLFFTDHVFGPRRAELLRAHAPQRPAAFRVSEMSQPGPATGNSTLPSLPGRILGIDAGGSGTRVILLENGTVTARPDGPPMNALLTDGFAGHLRQIIEAADATAAGVGMPGVRQPGQARDLSAALTRQTGRPVHVTGDADSARAGAFLGAPGVVVIAGTGSMASGWNGQSSARAGGHGFLLGDEGSAYWIGRAAVRAALRWEDGMGGSKIIHRAVIQAAGQGTESLDALIGEVCTHPAERGRLTALAPVVTALAAEDPEARTIALRAAEHLAALAEAIRRRLGPLPVAGAGRVFSAPVIWDRFAELTGAVRPLAAATVGAALLAAQRVNGA
jgi:N-acetylglucosamine kinase-like BadF-type ATPase